MAQQGVTHLIDLRAERKKNNILAGECEMSIVLIPIHDDWLPKTINFFGMLEKAIKVVINGNHQNKLFICCGAGEHRAPLAGALALTEQGYNIEDAMGLVKKARPVAEFLPVYVESLKKYLDEKEKNIGLGARSQESAPPPTAKAVC
jgi:hypothetical protein